jgi:hypothetical protein
MSTEERSQKAAGAAVRILRGEAPDDIKIHLSDFQHPNSIGGKCGAGT